MKNMHKHNPIWRKLSSSSSVQFSSSK